MSAGGALTALAVAGCGGGSSKPKSDATPAGAADPTKGKPGGKLLVQTAGFPATFDVFAAQGGGAGAGLCLDGLLGYRNGYPGVEGTSLELYPNLAQAMPEQPDNLTYVYKLRPGAKFHNGRVATSEDVAYSFNRYANFPTTPFRASWTWLDKVETPDAQTAVIKTKVPFADMILRTGTSTDAYVSCKEHVESPDGDKKFLGTGPYVWNSAQAPITVVYRKNPDYYLKPYPYFDEITHVASTDPAKRIADWSAKAINVTWWNSEEPTDEMRRNRPDGKAFTYEGPAYVIYMREDKPPFNDKRVRQALSMAVNRKQIRDAVSKGRGEDDQALSFTNRAYGFRKPSELGAAARYWTYDPAEAKKLLAAAGVDKPIETTWTHWNASVTGQATVDMATLTEASWRELGIANLRDVDLTGAQFTSTVTLGNYDGIAHSPGVQFPELGTQVRTLYYTSSDGVRAPQNNAYVNNPTLTTLLDKQLATLNAQDRKAVFRQMEDIIAEEQYRIGLSSYTQVWFADPSIENIQIPAYSFTGGHNHMKFWWFA